ncbi:pantetheine-phosphate adenylyltransferase [Streptococcus sp. CSL10205-OR2]|uniref:pantetheine-phosphate adenylyltransferase n=1 Tax=Streptococcus sp. CSL10205-OR2 TaxID=2980558 RepID=UPI0021DA59B3|nr:pantetheine-phosphate adenylyltransferase [Streptococcus sp. CSL10205-OR2]MCU9533445.1 pantetheine-phosphate adenylyltransferase [Streptococcus sp. CSL10205-OR2]
MSDKIGLYTGTFDPVTTGHIDVIKRAAKLVDKLYVGLFYNKEKTTLFSKELREKMLVNALAEFDNITVITSSNTLTVDVAKKIGASVLFRGIRNSEDLNYEMGLEFFNHHLSSTIETVYLLSKPSLQSISSSRVRELLHFKQDISQFVPNSVVEELERISENNKTI